MKWLIANVPLIAHEVRSCVCDHAQPALTLFYIIWLVVDWSFFSFFSMNWIQSYIWILVTISLVDRCILSSLVTMCNIQLFDSVLALCCVILNSIGWMVSESFPQVGVWLALCTHASYGASLVCAFVCVCLYVCKQMHAFWPLLPLLNRCSFDVCVTVICLVLLDFYYLLFSKSHDITWHHITSHHITSHHITSHNITSHHMIAGKHVSDVTNASRTLLMNIQTLTWDPDLCSYVCVLWLFCIQFLFLHIYVSRQTCIRFKPMRNWL
jgi:hypothetical protein